MMATFLPASSTGSCGQWKVWNERPLKAVHAFQPRQRRRRQQPDRENDEPACQLAAVVELEPPQIIRLVERGRLDLAVELHVFAQVELVGDVIEITQILGLGREAFLPVPLVEQFPREGITVGEALGVEARAGIAVPVPGSTEVGRGVQHQRVDAEIGQPLDLIDAGHARAYDDDFVVRPGTLGHARFPHIHCSWRRRLYAADVTIAIIRALHLRQGAGIGPELICACSFWT